MSYTRSIVSYAWIRNCGKIANGEDDPAFELNFSKPITVLNGSNAAAKTTICRGFRAVLSKTIDPEGLGARSLKHYLGRSSRDGFVKLEFHDQSTRTWSIKQKAFSEQGSPMTVVDAISGVANPILIDKPKEAAEAWGKLMKVSSSEETLRKWLDQQVELKGAHKIKLKGKVEVLIDGKGFETPNDWDKVAKEANAAITATRASFSSHMGGGSSGGIKGKTMLDRTQALLDKTGMDMISLGKMEQDLASLNRAIGAAAKRKSLDAFVKREEELRAKCIMLQDRLKDERKQAEPRKECIKAINSAKKRMDTLSQEAYALQVQLGDLTRSVFSCPSCKAKLRKTPEGIVLEGMGAEDKAKMMKASLEALKKEEDKALEVHELNSAKLRSMPDNVASLESELESVKTSLAEAEVAANTAREIAKKGDKRPEEELNEEAVALGARISSERASMRNRELLYKAQECALDAMAAEMVHEATCSEGLRKKERIRMVDEFNAVIGKVRKAGGIKRLASPSLDGETMLFSIGGRPVGLASAGERWLAQAVVQMALALYYKNTPLVMVMDGADVLDVSSDTAQGFWQALSKVVRHLPMAAAVVTATDFEGEYLERSLSQADSDMIDVVNV